MVFETTSFETGCKVLGIDTNLPDVSMLPIKYQKKVVNVYKMLVQNDAANKESNGGIDWERNVDKYEEVYEPRLMRTIFDQFDYSHIEIDILGLNTSIIPSLVNIDHETARHVAWIFVKQDIIV